MNEIPDISVLLPVRNGMPYIVEAIESIINQTFKNFEIIIVNDGSTDATQEFIESIDDDRIKIINTTGVGLVSALNIAISQSRGKYAARMDADDICMPDRFFKQIELLEKNENIGVVCSDILRIDEQGCLIGEDRYVIKNNDHLRDGLICKKQIKPIVHPSVMIRTKILREVGGYRSYHCAEDRDLWLRLVDTCGFHRINLPLLKYRITKNGISRMQAEKQRASSFLAVFNYTVFKKTSLDLYLLYPSIWQDFQRIFLNYSRNQTPAVVAFECAKNFIRNYYYFNAVLLILKSCFLYSNYFFPKLRMKKDYLFIDDNLKLCTAVFVAIKKLPDNFIDLILKD